MIPGAVDAYRLADQRFFRGFFTGAFHPMVSVGSSDSFATSRRAKTESAERSARDFNDSQCCCVARAVSTHEIVNPGMPNHTINAAVSSMPVFQ